MNDFNQFKEKVKQLIKTWKEEIKPGIEEQEQYGETNTRKYLIDPILDALNWADDGSKKVIDNEFAVKHKTGTGSADYALKVNNIPKILVEAKDVAKVKDLENGYDMIHGIKRTYPRQLSNYCHDLNYQGFDIQFAILTNGKTWILYNMQYADISSEREVVFRIDLEETKEDELLTNLWSLEFTDVSDRQSRIKEIIRQLHDYRLSIDKKAVQLLLECKDLLSNSILNDYEGNNRGIKGQIDKVLEDKEKINGMPTFHELPEEERLNFFIKEASSSIINKILFIRILEDKNFLTPKLTKRSIEKWKDFWGYRDYNEIMNLFREACRFTENEYNGGLFKLNPYDKIDYDPDVIKNIIDILGDINFRDIDSDIIGRIYEIYLGQVLKVEAEVRGKKRTRYQADNKERKKFGQYYTPKFIVDFIVKNTLGRFLESNTSEKVSEIRVLDPACGSGSFLIRTYDTLVEYYENRNTKILKKIDKDNRKNGATLDKYQDNGIIPNYKNSILKDNLYGVDLNDLSVQICEINLWLRALEKGKKLIKLNKNILNGNSLISGVEDEEELKEYKGELQEIKTKTNRIKDYYDKDKFNEEEQEELETLEKELKSLKSKINKKLNKDLEEHFGVNLTNIRPFNWEVAFSQVIEESGFDVVIGNPPYFNLKSDDDLKFNKDFEILSNGVLNVAALFIKKALDLLKDGGYLGFIIPKSFIYVESWRRIRDLVKKDYYITELADVSKAFEEVLLEQIIIIVKKEKPNPESLVKLSRGIDDKSTNVVKYEEILNRDVLIFEKNIAGIYEKCNLDAIPLGEISVNFRGIGAQKYAKSYGKIPIISGENIQRYELREPDRFINDKTGKLFKGKIEMLKSEKICCQNIVAHIRDHIQLTAYYDSEGMLVLDTVNNIKLVNNSYLPGYILALLNSKLISFYTYKFIYFNAIRTMHFDGDYSGRIPIKKLSREKQKKISDAALKIQTLIKNKNELLKKFEEAFNNQTITDEKACKFLHYWNNNDLYGFVKSTAPFANKTDAKVLEITTKEEGDGLFIYTTYIDAEQNQKHSKIKTIGLDIKEEKLRKFLYYSLNGYLKKKKGRGFGSGIVLDVLTNMPVPVYVQNVKMNLEKISKIMREFEHETKKLWESLDKMYKNLTDIEEDITKTKNELDEWIYGIYGIKEKEIIETSIRV